MNVVIFTGPTISAEEARRELEAVYLPPASQGDVYRAALKHPRVIGIIDGLFERAPAVWHKEILWAMSSGIHVFGAASMGALRAAELAAFGMEGVGAIFSDYATGRLEDDDEVAVAHASAEHGFSATSEAMVDIRATLAAAASAGAVSAETSAILTSLAKSMFYPDRSYPELMKSALRAGCPADELGRFREWLPEGRVNRKRADAIALLRLVRERLAAGLDEKRVRYTFENSFMWEQARTFAGEQVTKNGVGAESMPVESVLDELRLEGGSYLRAKQEAVRRSLAIQQSHLVRMCTPRGRVDAVRNDFRSECGLVEEEQVQDWLRSNEMDEEDFARLVDDEARVRWIDDVTDLEATARMFDVLRISGDFPRLVERARSKQAVLEAQGLNEPALADLGLDGPELMRWYFEDRLGRPVPSDLKRYWKRLGFESLDAFRRSLLREHAYLRVRRTPA